MQYSGDAGNVSLKQIVSDVIKIRRQSYRPGGKIHTLQLIECSEPGGSERMLLQLACNLSDPYDATVGLLTSGWLEDQVKQVGLPYIMLGGDERRDLRVIADVVRVIRTGSIRLIHAHEFYMGVIGAVVSRLTGIPLVVTIHGKNYYPDRMRRRLMFRMTAMQASGFVMVSDELKRFVCAITGVPRDDVLVIHNGVESGQSGGVSPAADLRVQAGIPPNASVIGTVGALFPVKGQRYLIEAFRMVRARMATAHLVILGEGQEREVLEQEARRLGVQDSVHLLGFRDDVPAMLPQMDVFTLPSLSEGLPLALLEAMAAKRPVVVTQVGGMPEVVEDGKTGLLVPPGDAKALATQLLRILENPGLATQLGEAGRDTVCDRFSHIAMLGKYQEIYRQGVAA